MKTSSCRINKTEVKDEVSALARGLAVLRALASADAPLSNRELAETTGIPKATVSRLASTLVAAGYLRQQEDSERFVLGATLLDLSNAYLRNFDLRTVVRPYLAALAEFAGATVHLAVRDGLDVVLIDSIRPSTQVVVSRLDVGSRMSIPASGAGRAYLSALDETGRKPLLDAIRAATGKDWGVLRTKLDAAMAEYAEQGYCSSFGEWHPEIHALGFSLSGPRGEVYGLSCGGPAYRLPRDFMIDKVGPRIRETVRAIAREVGAMS
ncbi:MAG: IclR family transcriptional regulator [Candidatus Protistobacter heckmanni]|nr:IclR family transcriptional regulator [Candidatus Protistobacter heckmanni]